VAVAVVTVGVDLLTISGPSKEQAAAHDAVVTAVESEEITREQIDASVERIKNIKGRYPLYGCNR
jgi:beta-glucosidase-like glycosyl hydrolase